jgi:hypothetical protein
MIVIDIDNIGNVLFVRQLNSGHNENTKDSIEIEGQEFSLMMANNPAELVTNYYYDITKLKLCKKEINPTAINNHTLSDLPIPSTVRIGSEEFLVEDGELEMTFDLPGTYTINVDSFPFQDATFEVTV